MDDQTEHRKNDHLRICLEEEVRAPFVHSLDQILLEYDAVPELDLDEVDLSTTVLDRPLRAPVLIGAMTGGSEQGGRINQILAEAAARVGVGMGLGSQRAMIERPELAATYDVRAMAPDVPLVIGNIGAVQLNHGVGAAELRGLFEAISMDALAFHLNPLQEAIQPEGDTDFRGVLGRLERVIPRVEKPCLVKEVGTGISARAAGKLARLPVQGIEAAGVGGTSWALVEARRAGDEPVRSVGRSLAWFGVDTAGSIRNCREHFGDRVVIGSGGIETGYHVAAAIALGADAVAITGPLLKTAANGVDQVTKYLENIIHELRIVMFCTGARTIPDLRRIHHTRVDIAR